MDEEGCFDVCVSEPEPVELDCFALWLEGLTLAHAARRRATEMSNLVRRYHAHLHDNSSPSESPSMSTTAATAALMEDPEVVRFVRASLADSFRVFDLLESPLYNPPSFLGHPFIQLPVPERLLMVEMYYTLDPAVAREIIWRKQSAKRIGKDLEEIKESTGVSLRSCRRQHDNWKRVYTILEEQRGFQCHVAHAVEQSFLLSPALACQYTVCIFLAFHHFVMAAPSYHHHFHQQQQTSSTQSPHASPKSSSTDYSSSSFSSQPLHPQQQQQQQQYQQQLPHPALQHLNRTHALSFSHFEFMSLAVLVFWVPESPRTTTTTGGSSSSGEKAAQQQQQEGSNSSGSRAFASLSHRLESVSISSGVGGHRGRTDSLSLSYPPVAAATEGRTVAEVVRSLLELAGLMVEEEGEGKVEVVGGAAGSGIGTSRQHKSCSSSTTTIEQGQQQQQTPPSPSCWARPEEGARLLLQARLRDTYGMELEKVLLVSLRELSRFFNDTTVLEQYQAEVTIYLLNQEGAGGGGGGEGANGGLLGNWAKVHAVERRFKAILRPLSALGWGLSLQKELKDYFEDVLVKVTHPLRDLGLSRRDLCHLFSALINSFYSIPVLNEGKSKSIPQMYVLLLGGLEGRLEEQLRGEKKEGERE